MKSEMVVFLPFYAPLPPVETARALVAQVSVARALVGEDLLTGAITVRLPLTQSVWDAATAFLAAQGVPCEIEAI